MDFNELIKKSRQIKTAYDRLNREEGNKVWSASEYAQGLVGDIGDLMKLIMAKRGFRFSADGGLNQKLAREIADCLWSIIIIADELDIDLEKEFLKTMRQLENKIGERKVLKK